MTSTRKRVLKTLLTRQRCTINELADVVGINPISVRHHINKLEADGMVTSEEERHGVGRPHRLYFLTDKGMEQFPTRYLQLTIRLLEQIKETMPEPMVGKLFSQMAADMAEDYTSEADIDHLDTEERLDLLKTLLAEEGFTVEWEQRGDHYHIREVSCPYYHVGQSHPEVCSVDQTLISTVLSVPVEKVNCILNGDSYCTYVVPKPEKIEVSKVEN
ncbi:MAG: winged helix-turn-helix transcriptional regulator [Anaerolineales bacterium]|jgi:predicted ArsR family transcriptional regulator